MATVSKVFVALLVGYMMKECLVCADSSSGSSDEECDRGFVRCKIVDGEIGCVDVCNFEPSQCEGVDDTVICDVVESCPLPNTLVVETTETSIIANCIRKSGGGSCAVECFGSAYALSCDDAINIPTCAYNCTTCYGECL